MTAKEKIIEIFRTKIKGKSPNINQQNIKHDGKKGHWLEQQFGITANANNLADLWGYELKNHTTSKTTFGDWSANIYIFNNPLYKDIFIGHNKAERQNSFLKIFGKQNLSKGGRYSWSGSPCPKINIYNDFGQTLIVTKNKDIIVYYSYIEDKREDKKLIIPKELQINNLEIAKWYGTISPSDKKIDKCLKAKLENKFNINGWFICKTNDHGVYNKICFGQPINYDMWIKNVELGLIFFDSGMYEGNSRPYSQWRASNDFWNNLITEEYE